MLPLPTIIKLLMGLTSHFAWVQEELEFSAMVYLYFCKLNLDDLHDQCHFTPWSPSNRGDHGVREDGFKLAVEEALLFLFLFY